jgi:hypothetical protein
LKFGLTFRDKPALSFDVSTPGSATGFCGQFHRPDYLLDSRTGRHPTVELPGGYRRRIRLEDMTTKAGLAWTAPGWTWRFGCYGKHPFESEMTFNIWHLMWSTT